MGKEREEGQDDPLAYIRLVVEDALAQVQAVLPRSDPYDVLTEQVALQRKVDMGSLPSRPGGQGERDKEQGRDEVTDQRRSHEQSG